MIKVTKTVMPPFEEYCNEIKDLWESHWLTNMGQKHQRFQQLLGDFIGADKVELFVTGHMAIEMVLQAFGLKGEIITTPYTFASTTHAIVRNGCVPVFCDINEHDCTIDVEKIENLITPNTVAILPVHVYGNICDVNAIKNIADKYNLKVIYDAAHAFGEYIDGIPVGNYGDASCFSFHATKVFNSIEGGAVVYHDEVIGERLYELKNFGIHGVEEVCGIGANAKMNEFSSAMGICNLRYFEENLKKRKEVYKIYVNHLMGIKGINICELKKSVTYNYSYFPIFVNENEFGASRDEIQLKLFENDIGSRKYFYPITSEFDCYKENYDSSLTPIALRKSKEVLSLPFYADLDFSDINKICKIIKKMSRRNYF